MNKVLKDMLAVKSKKMDGQKEWSFKAPSYDNRTSCSVSAGDDYGIGVRTPVGKEAAGSLESGPIPMKSHMFSPKEIFDGEDSKG
jgi:hypothetical protein